MPPGGPSSHVGGRRLALLRPRRYTRATYQGPGRGHWSHSCTVDWPCPCFGYWKQTVIDGSFGPKCLVLLSAEQIFWLNYCTDVSELLLHLERAQMAFSPNPALSHGKTWEWKGGPGSWAAYVLEIHTSCSFGRLPGHAENRCKNARHKLVGFLLRSDGPWNS